MTGFFIIDEFQPCWNLVPAELIDGQTEKKPTSELHERLDFFVYLIWSSLGYLKYVLASTDLNA